MDLDGDMSVRRWQRADGHTTCYDEEENGMGAGRMKYGRGEIWRWLRRWKRGWMMDDGF